MRYAFQNNIDFNMSKSSKISLHLYAGLDNMHGPLAGSNDISGSLNDLYNQMMNANPVLFPIQYDNEGDEWVHWGYRQLANGGNFNPMARLVSGYQDSFASTITANLNFDQKLDFITKGLGFHLMFSLRTGRRVLHSARSTSTITSLRTIPRTRRYILLCTGSEGRPIEASA